MSRISFENFGKFAELLDEYTVISGRYLIQGESERRITGDILKKLELQPSDSVLEIGCVAGNLLIPISFLVGEITGIDHESCIRRLKARFPEGNNVSLIAGNFLDVSLDKKYEKILCYSVLHYLSGIDEVFKFIDKALQFLAPGGKALFGDIPNQSVKKRFIDSEDGKRFVKEWDRSLRNQSEVSVATPKDTDTVQFDDVLVTEVIKLFRDKGYHTYILPQPPELPFGHTREDILIRKPG